MSERLSSRERIKMMKGVALEERTKGRQRRIEQAMRSAQTPREEVDARTTALGILLEAATEVEIKDRIYLEGIGWDEGIVGRQTLLTGLRGRQSVVPVLSFARRELICCGVEPRKVGQGNQSGYQISREAVQRPTSLENSLLLREKIVLMNTMLEEINRRRMAEIKG